MKTKSRDVIVKTKSRDVIVKTVLLLDRHEFEFWRGKVSENVG